MRRRDLVAAMTTLVVSSPLLAQSRHSTRARRIGWLALNSKANPHQISAFRSGLAENGLRENSDVMILVRDALGQPDRLRTLADELVQENIDVLVAGPTQSTLAAMAATQTIPIVFPVAADPVGSGLVESLSRPKRNVTGLSLLASDLVAKCLDVLTQIAPDRREVAILWNPGGHSHSTDADMLRQAEHAGHRIGLNLSFIEIRGPNEIEVGLKKITKIGAKAVCVLPYALFFQHRREVIDLISNQELVAVYPWREFVDSGGLVSYGANTADLYRRAAGYVDRILRGAKPGDLAVEQPTKFEFVLNIKAAKAINLEVPPLILARADEVIE